MRDLSKDEVEHLNEPNPVQVEYLTGLAYARAHWNQGDLKREELLIRHGGAEYSVIIEDMGREFGERWGGRWELGMSLLSSEQSAGIPVLDEGVEKFATLDEAIVSAMLTVIEWHGQPIGTWRSVRSPKTR